MQRTENVSSSPLRRKISNGKEPGNAPFRSHRSPRGAQREADRWQNMSFGLGTNCAGSFILCWETAATPLRSSCFLAGNNIAAGGFSGIAIVLSSVLPVSIGTFIFLLNIPFLLLSLFIKGKRYTLLTLCGSTIYATILNAISFLPTVTENRLVAAVFGGLIYGVGAVFFLKSNASNGGTDLVARLLQTKFRSMSVGKMFLAVDGSVVIFAMIMFRDIEAGAVCNYHHLCLQHGQ